MKSQIQNKKNDGIVELLTLNKIIRTQGTYFVVIMNNRLKIVSICVVQPSNVWEDFSKKRLLFRRPKLFWDKTLWGGCSK